MGLNFWPCSTTPERRRCLMTCRSSGLQVGCNSHWKDLNVEYRSRIKISRCTVGLEVLPSEGFLTVHLQCVWLTHRYCLSPLYLLIFKDDTKYTSEKQGLRNWRPLLNYACGVLRLFMICKKTIKSSFLMRGQPTYHPMIFKQQAYYVWKMYCAP